MPILRQLAQATRPQALKALAQRRAHALKTRFKRAYYKQHIAGDLVALSQAEVAQRLAKVFPNAKVFWEDSSYYVCSLSTMRELIEQCWVDEVTYASQVMDCDKFSMLFKSVMALYYHLNNIAIVLNYSGQHSFNLLILKEGIFIYEPQAGKFWKPGEDHGVRYKVDGEIILI
jgi:hypothetical protein